MSLGGSIPGDFKRADSEEVGEKPGYIQVCCKGAGNLNIKRLLLIQKTQISHVKRFGDLLCMGRGKCLGLLKSFLSYLRGANPAFLIAHNLIPCLPSEMAGVVDGRPSQPPSSSADVADGLRIAGFISLGLRNFYLEKACLQVESRAETFPFALMSNGFPN